MKHEGQTWKTLRNKMCWKSKSEYIALKNMSKKHILNCIQLIRNRSKVSTWWGYSSALWIMSFENELNYRKELANYLFIKVLSPFTYSPLARGLLDKLEKIIVSEKKMKNIRGRRNVGVDK